MSSPLLRVSDEAASEKRKGGGDEDEALEDDEVNECPHNGVLEAAGEGGGEGESGSELEGEEEVLYDTSSHERLESSSGNVGGGEKTWEERWALPQTHIQLGSYTTSCVDNGAIDVEY